MTMLLGILCLLSGWALMRYWIHRKRANGIFDFSKLIWVFVVFAVGLHRRSFADSAQMHAATGGFSLWCETIVPVYPALVDETVLTWSLGKKQGDTIFSQIWSQISSSEVMLVKVPEQEVIYTQALISQALNNYGVRVMTTGERMKMFNSVTDAYLTIFLTLGGLGLLLGIFLIPLCAIFTGALGALAGVCTTLSNVHLSTWLLVASFLALSLFGVERFVKYTVNRFFIKQSSLNQ